MLLNNGYPSTFIENEFNKCFFQNKSTSPFLLPIIYDEKQSVLMRQKLIGEMTLRQSQTTMRATTADMNNDQTDNQLMQATESTKEIERKTIYSLYI